MRAIFKTIIPLLLIGLLFTSCKKDFIYGDTTPNTDRAIVEFTNYQVGENVATDFTTNVITLPLTELRLMTRSVVKADVTVTVKADPTVVADYNTENGTSFASLPASVYTFDQSSFTLTSDSRSVMVAIKLKPSDLLSGDYAIGLSIATVTNGEISPVAKTIFIQVSVKNKYDGVYTVSGSFTDAAGVYEGDHPLPDVQLRTAGANAVDYLDPNFSVGAPINNNIYIIYNIASGNPALLFSPRFVFDPTTNKATGILDVDGGLAPTGIIAPGDPNQFTITNPDSKKFVIKYTVFGRFTISETFTYTGPR